MTIQLNLISGLVNIKAILKIGDISCLNEEEKSIKAGRSSAGVICNKNHILIHTLKL